MNDPYLFDVAFDRLNGNVQKLSTLLAPVLIEFDEVISKLLLASFLVIVILDDVKSYGLINIDGDSKSVGPSAEAFGKLVQ